MGKITLADILGSVAVTAFWCGVITADCEVPVLPVACFVAAAAAGIGCYIESGWYDRDKKNALACGKQGRSKVVKDKSYYKAGIREMQ